MLQNGAKHDLVHLNLYGGIFNRPGEAGAVL